MPRWVALIPLLAGCGDLEADRICENPPCLVPGRPSPECQAFLTCAYGPGMVSPGSLDSTFGPGGVCWMNPDTASACTASCTSGLASFRSVAPGC